MDELIELIIRGLIYLFSGSSRQEDAPRPNTPPPSPTPFVPPDNGPIGITPQSHGQSQRTSQRVPMQRMRASPQARRSGPQVRRPEPVQRKEPATQAMQRAMA